MCRCHYYIYDDIDNTLIPLISLLQLPTEIVTPTPGEFRKTRPPHVCFTGPPDDRTKFRPDRPKDEAIVKGQQTDTLLYRLDMLRDLIYNGHVLKF